MKASGLIVMNKATSIPSGANWIADEGTLVGIDRDELCNGELGNVVIPSGATSIALKAT